MNNVSEYGIYSFGVKYKRIENTNNAINYSGKKIGKLSVLFRVKIEKNKSKIALWLCQCECGKIKVIQSQNLSTGTASCGCLHKEAGKIVLI